MSTHHTETLSGRATARDRVRRVLGGALAIALALGASLSAVVADAAQAAAPRGAVAGASLDWGIKESFRKYIGGPIAQGSIVMLGSTAPTASGSYHWGEGSGESAVDGSEANVSFGVGNGVQFRGHSMQIDGQSVAVLDAEFTNPRVVVTSPTTGEVRMDVQGFEFKSTTELGEPFSLIDAPIASLTLPQPTVDGSTLTWTDASAVLTEEGSVAFGGGAFYAPGEALDPVTFTLPVEAGPNTGGENPGGENPGGENPGGENPGGENPGGENPGGENPEVVQTGVKMNEASTTLVSAGKPATFIADVSPENASGSIQFLVDGKPLGAPVEAQKGRSTLQTAELKSGTHTITARFVPADPKAFAPSESTAHSVRVTAASGGTSKIENATLEWGVRESFRKYIYDFTAFKGRAQLLGTTKQPQSKGAYLWSGGTGTAADDGTRANVGFGSGNGVHFQSHPMTVGGKTVYALDLKFTNPRIEILSPTSGRLHMDVDGYTFEGMESVGKKFTLRDTPMAQLSLSVPKLDTDSGLLSWSNVGARLTAEGEIAFGGFYEKGSELDPLNFSLPGDFTVIDRQPTSVTLSATPASAKVGATVTFTATVNPRIDGKVTFSYGTTKLGSPVSVSNGVAKLATTKLPEGVYTAQALFEPADSENYSHSNSNSVKLTIDSAAKPVTPKPTAPPAAPGAGSLKWGISSQFAGYTTARSNTAACPTAGKHCAGGEIATSGVGSGYLFPQAGSTWNAKNHTGTVNYTGSVSFKGYGTTMFSVINPTITVTGPATATLTTGYSGSYGPSSVQLDLSRATKTVGSGGEVTWSNVPVVGSLMGLSASQSIAFDALSFTVGAASKVSYGSTVAGKDAKEKRVAAATPPTTEGLTIVTDKDKLVPGARIEIQAAGFDPEDEGVLVVLYSDPIVLDEEATADKFGVVHWTGKLPDDIQPGAHVLTLQGSTDVGAKITILPKDAKAKKSAEELVEVTTQPLAAATGAGPVLGAGGSGMALWEWWVVALSLVAIAGCTTTLAVRQRAANR
ncbi:HtaA domain-containing protein [Leucobacter aridicollis]|uniref:HtaA domain-containing protein n=1 Tax=Leucobacter aridicollis TaxID=283878 RepID=UPI002102F55F|nr:HtaA domain-containing protein [Leucobacter aridicollis]UTX52734.1 HtaA domain-containing protein [Leucobacter aridicollis]